MRGLIAVGLVVLAGCTSEPEKLERQYEIVSKGRDNRATCDAARKVASAYLSASNEAKYQDWKLTSDVRCTAANFDAYDTSGLDVTSDNMTAVP